MARTKRKGKEKRKDWPSPDDKNKQEDLRRTGGAEKDRRQWVAAAVLVLVVSLVALLARRATAVPTTWERGLIVRRQFASRYSQVYVIPNFLPNETAQTWRQSLQRLWNRTLERLETENETSAGEETCGATETACPIWDGFTYTTNNNGEPSGHHHRNNAKVRSLSDMDRRRRVARQMKDRGAFAYSKWELDPSHPLIAEMERTLTDPALMRSVDRILRRDYPTARLDATRRMSDLFATHFGPGDFLSTHNDGVSGSWAVVIGLVEDDYDGAIHGGGLQFQCDESSSLQQKQPETGSYCETLHPEFNTAVIFGTRVKYGEKLWNGPNHQVLEVARPQGGRYAITGWWMDKNDPFDDPYSVKEREKARGRK